MGVRRCAGLALACVAGLALVPGVAGAAVDEVPPVVCGVEFTPPPRLDDFIVHATGVITCDRVAGHIKGTISLSRDGNVVVRSGFHATNVMSSKQLVKTTPCVDGEYRAALTANGVAAITVESVNVRITC